MNPCRTGNNGLSSVWMLLAALESPSSAAWPAFQSVLPEGAGAMRDFRCRRFYTAVSVDSGR